VSDEPPARRRRGLPGFPLLGRGGLVLGVGILLALVVLGGTFTGGEDARVNAIADPLGELPAFRAGTVPAVAPDPERDLEAFGRWAEQRAREDWKAAFAEAGRPWVDVVRRPKPAYDPRAGDPAALVLVGVGERAASHVSDLLGIPGRLELARRDRPEAQAQLLSQSGQMEACLAGAWARTLLTPARLAAATAPTRARSVRLGAEIGDPSVCDTFSASGGR